MINIILITVLSVLQVLLLIIPLLIAVAYFTLAERKIMASMQQRQCINVFSFFGLLHHLLGGLKFSIKNLFILVPLIAFQISLMSWVVALNFSYISGFFINALNVLYSFYLEISTQLIVQFLIVACLSYCIRQLLLINRIDNEFNKNPLAIFVEFIVLVVLFSFFLSLVNGVFTFTEQGYVWMLTRIFLASFFAVCIRPHIVDYFKQYVKMIWPIFLLLMVIVGSIILFPIPTDIILSLFGSLVGTVYADQIGSKVGLGAGLGGGPVVNQALNETPNKKIKVGPEATPPVSSGSNLSTPPTLIIEHKTMRFDKPPVLLPTQLDFSSEPMSEDNLYDDRLTKAAKERWARHQANMKFRDERDSINAYIDQYALDVPKLPELLPKDLVPLDMMAYSKNGDTTYPYTDSTYNSPTRFGIFSARSVKEDENPIIQSLEQLNARHGFQANRKRPLSPIDGFMVEHMDNARNHKQRLNFSSPGRKSPCTFIFSPEKQYEGVGDGGLLARYRDDYSKLLNVEKDYRKFLEAKELAYKKDEDSLVSAYMELVILEEKKRVRSDSFFVASDERFLAKWDLRDIPYYKQKEEAYRQGLRSKYLESLLPDDKQYALFLEIRNFESNQSSSLPLPVGSKVERGLSKSDIECLLQIKSNNDKALHLVPEDFVKKP